MTTNVYRGGQKGPGLRSVVQDDANVRENGANIANTAMQSPSSMASQMRSVSSLSGVSMLSDNSLRCGCHSRDHNSFYSASPPNETLRVLLSLNSLI